MKNKETFLPSMLRYLSHFLLCLVLISALSSCESRLTIVNNLDEKEANEILVFLANQNINATKTPLVVSGGGGGGNGPPLWNITVPGDKANDAMALLNQAGLPRRRGQNLLGIFTNTGLVPSGMNEKVRYQSGLAEQIASTIRKFGGVLDADVQISIPEEDPLNPTATKQKITSAVYVQHNGVLDDPNAHMVTRIKRLVAGSVPGLDYDNVTVIGDRARSYVGSGTGESLEAEKSYVTVWTLTLAKGSVARFQIIFFTFIFSILLLFLALCWLLWKFFPVLKKSGGFKQLFNYHAIHPENLGLTEAPKVENVDKPPEDKKPEDPASGRGIDET